MHNQNYTFSIALVISILILSPLYSGATSNLTLFEDFDKDGLSNSEETALGTDPYNADSDGDSYSDYTEVVGGYNPLKPAPGDKIIPDEVPPTPAVEKKEVVSVDEKTGEEDSSTKENLTQKAATQIAQIASEATAEGTEVTLDSVESLVSQALEEANKEIQLPEIADDEIKILKQGYKKLDEEERKKREKEDTSEYLSKISYIVASAMSNEIDFNDQEGFSSFVQSEISNSVSEFSQGNYKIIQQWADRGESILNLMNDVEVPENVLPIHKKGLQIAKYALSLEEESTPNAEDPIGNIAILSRAQGLIALAGDFQQEVTTILETIGVQDMILDL